MTEEMINIPSDAWGKKFLFSVITPVYNTEEYVEETIESVLSQSIGFMENIQLILVNNATTDNAGAICERYAKQYPHNIVYVELPENRGPSGARNAGIPYVRGKYVNFLDSDDKWDENAFKQVRDFLAKHEEIKCISCRKKYFDAWDGWFYDDRIFHSSRVCDIFTEPENAQFWIGPMFFSSSVLAHLSFDENAKYSEDMKFANEVILNEEKFGIVREAVFCYRKRDSENLSQVQVQRTERYWYFDAIIKSYFYFINLSKQRYGEVIPYIQHVLMQELHWRITQRELPADFTLEDREKYLGMLREMLENVDDYIILSQPGFWKEYQLFALQLKYGADVLNELEMRKNEITFRNMRVFGRDEKQIVTILGHEIIDGVLQCELQLNFPLAPETFEFFFMDSKRKRYLLQPIPENRTDGTRILGVDYGTKFRGTLQVALPDTEARIYPVFCFKGIEYPGKMQYAKQSRLSLRLEHSCCIEPGVVLIPGEDELRLVSTCRRPAAAFESAVRKELWTAGHKRGLVYRVLAPWLRRGKKSWILYLDRTPNAPEDELELRKAAIEAALRQKGADIPVWLVCPEKELEWASRYATPVEPSGWNWARTVFSAEAVLSFNWNQVEVFGWHTDLVRDLLTHRRVDLNDFL